MTELLEPLYLYGRKHMTLSTTEDETQYSESSKMLEKNYRIF